MSPVTNGLYHQPIDLRGLGTDIQTCPLHFTADRLWKQGLEAVAIVKIVDQLLAGKH